MEYLFLFKSYLSNYQDTYNEHLRSCTVHVDNSLFVQLVHTNYYKIVKLLKSFKIITVATPCFGLHKPSSGSSQPMLRQSYNVDIGYIYRYLKLSVLWLHILFSPVMRVDRPRSTRITGLNYYNFNDFNSLMIL
jgi:hypothetical protein